MTYRTLAARILAAPARAGGTRVVAVDGPSGSGKTTFAARLSAALSSPVIHMDDVYPGWEGLADAAPRLVEWVLAPLASGLPARYRRFDWERSEYARWREVPRSRTLVVEGVGSGALAAAPYLSYLVWVKAPRDIRMERGMERDGEAYRPHWERWATQEAAMFASDRMRERADALVDGAPTAPHDPEREFVLLEK